MNFIVATLKQRLHKKNSSGSYDVVHLETSAELITAGTFGGQMVANATAVATIGTKQVRNIYAGTTDMTAGSSSLPSGDIYLVYE